MIIIIIIIIPNYQVLFAYIYPHHQLQHSKHCDVDLPSKCRKFHPTHPPPSHLSCQVENGCRFLDFIGHQNQHLEQRNNIFPTFPITLYEHWLIGIRNKWL